MQCELVYTSDNQVKNGIFFVTFGTIESESSN